jgi:hypothetical protein
MKEQKKVVKDKMGKLQILIQMDEIILVADGSS